MCASPSAKAGVDDIDSTRMLIRVEQGKEPAPAKAGGRKDRNAMLSPQLVGLLRLWWKEGKRRSVMLPHGWLFPGRSATDPISTRQINRAIHEVAEAAGIRKQVSPHTLRHSPSLTRGSAIRRFLLHVLPHGFHRIRHYGLLASSAPKASIARARELLAVAPPAEPVEAPEPLGWLPPCPCCGGRMTIIETFGRMTIIETFGRWRQPRAPPHAPASTGSSPS
jgi:hypothetical protein